MAIGYDVAELLEDIKKKDERIAELGVTADRLREFVLRAADMLEMRSDRKQRLEWAKVLRKEVGR
jgi:hypothetical protein